ncbi:hypothetical protein EDC94DRAFT_692320 [Helicostylum pulchrum]|nr:hypothetical protein EDC94DRAFT_692320 [Helicostylum pulchrum]
MTSFPKGWFFIKNLNNDYVLSTEKFTAGEPVVIASIRSKDYDTQLWQHGEDGRLHNKKTGFVLDLTKGLAKVGSEIIQDNDSDSSESQTFAMNANGHIFLVKNPKLVLGIKESFFTRREGQHVHLQTLEKNTKEHKEQRWEFILPSNKRSVTSSPIDSLKRTISGASLGSFSSNSSTFVDDDGCLDESSHNQLNSFPDSAFFIKSESNGYFIGVDASSVNSPGSRLSIEPLRKNNYESQLWHYDVISGRLMNTKSGFSLSAEELSDDSYICQSSSSTDKDMAFQSWTLTESGEIRLKNNSQFVLGFKKDSWFGLNREGSNVLLQKKTDNKSHSHHKFVVVLPIFKKTTTEIVTTSEQIGVFPDGYFFIKNQKHGLVITVLETDKLAAAVLATSLDSVNYNRQLWKHDNGFLFNKASNLVLDVRGGCIVNGSEICQYKQKQDGFENQQWGLSVEGYIHAKTEKKVVLAISGTMKNSLSLYLANKKTPDHEEQRWNFVLPVFKQKSATVAETTVQKSVSYHHYAQYPSGWFFIRSFAGGASSEFPLVLTASSSSHNVSLTKISKEEWRYQLWMYWNGVLINFATQLAMDVDNVNAGSTICQEARQAESVSQRWSLTIDGFLVHGSNPSLTLVPQVISGDQYKIVLGNHTSGQKENRWGLLSPEIKVENSIQILSKWSITFLTEWKQNATQTVQKIVHRVADWPEDTFFISAQDGLALVPEKSEAYSFLVVKKLEFGQSEHFKWTYRNGYVVHVATGLVLHASDDLVGGSQLQIREQLLADSKTIDQRQKWVIKTDGSIISELKTNLGFALLLKGDKYLVQLAYASNTSEHYSWGFVRGHYESRYSDIYKKEVTVITRTERILLTVQTQRTSASANTKLVAHTYGVFPENWFYIRSKEDSSLVLTAPSRKEGAKLVLSKIDFKIFRRQLWHVQDDGCLINLESDFVIDVAGGAFNAGSDIIQYHEKYLRKHRKNQVWGLSVDGHLHPKARPGLVLGVKGQKAVDGAEIQLHTRGSLDLGYQLWTFASPIFGRTVSGVAGVSAAGVLESNDSDIFIDSVSEATFETTTTDRYERRTKLTVVRRWGLFPEGGFFIRSNYGDEHLSLTVEKKARTGENGRPEFEVTLRPINFKEYQWHFWFYQEGHLINAQTGLALDASVVKGLLVEDGLRTPLFVRDKSMTENQFWSLTVDGEVYLRSDERLVIGVSNSRRTAVSGAQVGLRELRVRTYMNENNQQESSLKSEPWLRWVFSKPVYSTKTSTTTTTTSTTVSQETSASGLVTAGEVVEGCTDEVLNVQHKEESADDYSVEDDDDSDDDESDDEVNRKSSLSTAIIGNLGIATAGAGIMAGAAGVISNVITSVPETISTAVIGKQHKQQSQENTSHVTKKTSYKSLKYDRKESYHASIEYIPTGFEKVIRYKTHQKFNFPTTGYFMIKSYLHGFVLDVVDGNTKDGAFVVLAPIKTTNFASQLWSFRDGRVINLKGHNLALDATMTDVVKAGERVVISTKTGTATSSDQHWEFGVEGGLIQLKSDRNLVLSVKELNRVTNKNSTVDVYLQEEKSHLKSNFGRPEQRWEIKVPAMVPVDQTTNATSETKYTIIEGGKISAISSSVSAIIAFEWLKETFHHKVSANNQWPSIQNWFFVRLGSENAFLSSGSSDSTEIKFVSLSKQEDHKQFLWAYVDGYLVNYKYMLRLVYDKQSKKLHLSSKPDTLEQRFSVSSQGVFSVRVNSETIYFNVSSKKVTSSESFSYELVSTATEIKSCKSEQSLQLHIPIFSDAEVEKDSKIALSTVISWVQSSQKSSTTTTTHISQRYGIFPQATWFFIKADIKDSDSLVLAVKNASNKAGSTLVLKRLSFKDFKSQLWTFRNGLLVNYGSKLVIDINGEIFESSKLVQTSEACVSSQKWSLTANGRIQLESYSQYTFGFHQTDNLVEGTEVVLVTNKETYEESATTQAIVWKFSVPVFGTKAQNSATPSTTATTTTTTTMSSIERISTCIEQGALIESIEEAEIKIEDTFVKKNSAASNSSSSVSTDVVQKEKQHGFQNILTGVGIAVTAGAVGVAAATGVAKITEKFSEHRDESKKTNEEKKQSSTSTVVKTEDQKKQESSKVSTAVQGNTSAVTDVDKVTETIIVRRSQRTSVQIIEESRVIIHAWKVIFSQRIHHCKSKAELIATVEESREELFRRLDEHLRVHASVENLVIGSVPEWHVSIHQVKELYRARVFEKFLDRLNTEEISNATELDFDSVLTTTTAEVENHYKLVISTQSKILSESSSSNQVQESQCTEVSIQENILVTVDTIKVTVRYWLIGLYETISIAKENGSSEEEIKVIVQDSRKKLTANLSNIKTRLSTNIEKSSSTSLTSKQTSITNTIETAISQTETVITNQINTICSQKQYLVTEEHWLDVTRTTEERLSSELKVYQTAITQEISEVQKTEISKSDQAEISVVLDEKMVVIAQQTVANKLVETKTKISSWYTEVIQQITLLVEDSETSSSSEETFKEDTVAIIDAAQIEINTRIEETKLVLRAYYAHLTYLSWAERRRIEYSLDNVKASVIASIIQFKKSIEKSTVTKESIVKYSSYSFGASASRIVLTDIQSIIYKVTNVTDATTVVKTSEDSKSKVETAVIDKVTADTKKSTETKQEGSKKTEVTKVDEVKKTEKIKPVDKTKIVDTIHTEVEETKIGNVGNKTSGSSGKQQSTTEQGSHHTAVGVSTAVLGAAAAAMASAAIYHQYEGKETQQEQKKQDKASVSTAVIEKPAITHTNVIVGKNSETIHVDEQKKTSTGTITKQEKSETLVVVYGQVQVTVNKWITTLNKRVYECAQKKSTNVKQEIDTIIYESQQQLVIEIEKAKRQTTTVIGTSQTSFHDTLSWVRSTVWKQSVEVKRIGYEFATSTETSTSRFEEKLSELKETTLKKIDVEIEKSKKSASVIHIVGHSSAAVIAVGKKFEGKDYSKTTCGHSVESSKVSVGILIEDTRVTCEHLFGKLTTSVSERIKQGGENVQADVEVIIKNSREEINTYIIESKTEFEKRLTVKKSSDKVDIELANETIKKVQSTLEKVQESYLTQVTRVEEITKSTTVISEVECSEKLTVITHETCEKLNATLSVSETIIGHHIEVIAESSTVEQTTSKTEKTSDSTTKISLGVEYGLLVVAETTKNVSSQISALVESVHNQVNVGSKTLKQDVTTCVETSNKEIDVIFEQAKIKISYELSMVSSHEKEEEEHFLATLESIRVSTKQRITQIETVATSSKEETKTVSTKLLQIAEESRHEVSAYYESVKQTVTKKAEKASQVIHNGGISHETTGSSQVIVSHTEEQKKQQELKKQQEHQSKVDLAKKVLAGSAAVAAGTAIAVEIAKKLSEHKKKSEKVEHTQKETAVVIENVQVQYQKWISTLTETVITQSKKTTVSTEEITLTVEKSKAEFIEIIKKASSSEVITEKHQHQILTWIQEIAIAQATRIQEIAISSSSSTAVNVESKLEIIKVSTSQEVEIALEKCKHSGTSVKEFVGVSVEHLQQKEAALLDIRSELVVVIQDVKSSLVAYFQEFTKSVISRIEKGGNNVEKDVAILIANTRKDLSVYVENVKNTATKRLSSLETKSSSSVISIAALSGIATAEIIRVLKSSEETIMQKVNRVHSSVWYIEGNQDSTEIIQSITTIESETTIEITEKIESSKYGFVTAINDQYKCGDVVTKVTEHNHNNMKASLTVQEIKVTIREWLRHLAETVSECSQKGGSSEEIDILIKKENTVIFEYLDVSVTKISETVKTEQYVKYLHQTIEQVKTSINKISSEIKVIAVESTSGSSSCGGFDKMTTIITQHEHKISETLVIYESKISSSTKKQETTAVDKTASTIADKKDKQKQKQDQATKKEVYSVVTVEYILSTVHTWLEELMVDVSEVAKREHDITVVTKEITSIVVDAKEFISAEFEMISKKIRTAKGDATAIQELINILDWTRGMVLQSSAQIQQIGVNCAVSFSSTGGIEQMRPLVHATESQIVIAVGRCNKTIKIEVERNSTHSEKHKVKKDCKKEERKKTECAKAEKKKAQAKKKYESSDSESDSESDSDDSRSDSGKKTSKSKIDCDKSKKSKTEEKVKKDQKKCDEKDKKSKITKKTKQSGSDSSSGSETEEKDKKKKSSIDKKKTAAGIVIGGAIGGAILKKYKDNQSSSSSSSESDSDSGKTKKQTTIVDKKNLSTSDVTIIVNQWYEKLIIDVSQRSKKGGSKASVDIELIVKESVTSITEYLQIISVNAHKYVTDTTIVQQYRASIEWTKNLVIQSSHQIKAIGINCAASSSSKTGGIEQMRPIAVAIQQQVEVEIRRYKLIVGKTEVTQKKTDTAVTVIEHKKNNENVCTGRKAAINRKEYCIQLEQHVSEVVAESKIIIISWFAQLVRDVSICIHQGDNVDENVSVIIEKSKLELESSIKRTKFKFTSSVDVYEQDKTFALVESQINESFKIIQTTMSTNIVKIQKIATKYQSETEVTEKLSTVLENSKVQITDTLETGCKQSITVIQQETTQTESTVTIIDTVESVKTVVVHWQTKLIEEIHVISIDNSIKNKEERIELLIKQATNEIDRATSEAKTKVSINCSSVKKISKSKEQELISSIEYVQKTFTTDVKKIQKISIEAIKNSDTNVKETVATAVHSSHEKIDTYLTRVTASVIGVATAAIAIHAVNKNEKKEDKKAEVHNEWSVDVKDNVTVLTKWFELFTKRVSEKVRYTGGDVVQNITTETEQAEQEITQIITTARTDFIKRLSHANMDQESYDYACKHYEESLEKVRISIISQVTEVKKIAMHAHNTGNMLVLESELTKLTVTSTESIKIAMGSTVVITHKAQPTDNSSTTNSGSVLQIEVQDDNSIVLGEEEIEFERKEQSVVSHEKKKFEEKKKTEKAEEKKQGVSIEKIAAGAVLAIGVAAGAAAVIKKEDTKKQQISIITKQKLKFDSGITTIESVEISISEWFTSLIQKVSTASKYGASSKKITLIVEESRTQLTEIIEHAKITGSTFCSTASDEQQFISKIEWVSSVAHNQAVQIQQIGINSSTGKTDLTSQMEALSTASYHQIQVTLEQLKTTLNFHQKINKIKNKPVTEVDSSKTTVVDKPVCGKMETSVDKTKIAYSVIQETRVTTVALFVSLSEQIITRVRQGGSNIEQDVTSMIELTEIELTKVFNEAKTTSSKVDKKTRLQIEEALTTVHKTAKEQMAEVKTVSIEAVSSTSTDSKVAIQKLVEVSKSSKSKVEYSFTTVSETITASLVTVTQTAKKTTETVQTWFGELTSKINQLLEADDCTSEETQVKIDTVVAEAEVEMKTKISKLQETATTKKTSSTTQVSTDHHLDVFFGNVNSSVQTQLETVKNTVKNTTKSDKETIIAKLNKTETQLKHDVTAHFEAVEQVTTVEHITGTEQKVALEVEKNRHENYKNTIEKVAIGSAAVAAAAAAAIVYHKKSQETQNTTVQVVHESSIKDVQVKIDIWFSQLTDKVTACTKKGGNNVSVEVQKIVEEAQAELDITIEEYKSQQTTTTSTSVTEKRTFIKTLEWVKTTAYTQSSQITHIVKQSSSSSIDLTTQIQNHVCATKQQIDSALEVHCKNDHTIEESKKYTGSNDKKEHINVVEVITESREQTQKRFTLETTVIVQESKTKVTSWLVLLLESITTILHGDSETIKKDIFYRLQVAEKEINVYIEETKQKFLTVSKTTATSHVEVETHTLVVNSVKQTLDCVDSMRTTLLLQMSVLHEAINRIEVEDIDVITKRLEAIITRTQKRVYHTLEIGISLAITSAFEGKVVTWTETAAIPASFKSVRAVAFDLLGTVANYHKTLYTVWKKIVTPKNNVVLSCLDFDTFVEDWYGAYTEVKRENFAKNRPVTDDVTLHEALIHILKRYYVKDLLTESETEQLCDAWRTVGVYDDASIGISRIKNQASAKYATVAISDTFSTRSMIELAQNNCLCFHAQFSAEMFSSQSSSTTTASESVVRGTIKLLGLKYASELAVVSSSAELVSAAKKQGCHAIFIEREESHHETLTECDVKVDGLDIFGESVQSFLEHESMTQVWTNKEAPAAPRVWVQKLKGYLY